jgi:hypothetical protein
VNEPDLPLIARLRRSVARLTAPWVWVETVALTGITVVLGTRISPEDPLFARAEFPWAWFAPVLLALRYGVTQGIVSSTLLLGAWFALNLSELGAAPPKLYFLGGLLLVMISGEYSSVWQSRLRRFTELNGYLDDRIERVTRRLYLVQLSHERLEQDLLLRPTTLQDALHDLRRQMLNQDPEEDCVLIGAQAFLDFLAQSAQLEVAALYALERGDNKRPSYLRAAQVGDAPPLDPEDPLLLHTEEHGTLAHVQTAALSRSLPTQNLVVAPMVSARGVRIGVLVVTRMPFFALNEDTLQLIAVLLASYADAALIADQTLPILETYPDCPIEFAEEYVKLRRLRRDFAIDSTLVLMEFGDHPLRAEALEQILRLRRTPDIVWMVTNENQRGILINMLPVSGRAAAEGYLFRMDSALRQNFAAGFADLGIRTLTVSFADPDPLASAMQCVAARPTLRAKRAHVREAERV